MRVLTGATPNDDISDGDLAELYAVPVDRPFLRVNMVSTVDGSATGEDARAWRVASTVTNLMLGALLALAQDAGCPVRHVKTHWAMGDMANEDADLVLAVARAIRTLDRDLIFVVMPGVETERARSAEHTSELQSH